MCTCDICSRHKRMNEILQKLDPEDQEWLKATMDYLLDVEADAAYHKAVLDGSMPNSEQILKQALHNLYVQRANNDPVVREA